MLLEHCRRHRQLTADLNFDSDDIEMMPKKLVSFHRCFHDAYGRIEHHRLIGLSVRTDEQRRGQARGTDRA